ncbi:MAG: hypothetical protein Greene07147_81 [Parcubacteria group bacterium Greene0714_7]|nr:MAG: hypothetical protein Greene07147_81 [Parcubacteria group bacterium Greene0714_7]
MTDIIKETLQGSIDRANKAHGDFNDPEGRDKPTIRRFNRLRDLINFFGYSLEDFPDLNMKPPWK